MSQTVLTRADIRRAVRAFFYKRDYIEVDTPIRIAAPPPEPHIDAIPSGAAYLRTSPELHMKRMLADGHRRLFQLGPCFRAGEEGPLHSTEFQMLEWYRAETDYRGILDETRDLILHIANAVHGSTRLNYQGHSIDLGAEWSVQTVSDAFRQHAGWDPCTDFDPDRFDLDLVERVEPALPTDRPAVLMDYPAEVAALSSLKPDDPRKAERWELYIGGLELANAYTELRDVNEHRKRFAEWRALRASRGQTDYPDDDAFFAAIERGLPPCGGIALGFDRLVMLLADAPTLSDINSPRPIGQQFL